jgi:hypothetical protein
MDELKNPAESIILADICHRLRAVNYSTLSLRLTEYHAMKTYWGNRCIAPCILNIGASWR